MLLDETHSLRYKHFEREGRYVHAASYGAIDNKRI